MAINLLNLVKDQLGDNLIGQASKLIGENQSATKSAIGAILPTILGSIVSKGSSTNGASQILNMINKDKHDGSMFNNLSGLLGGGAASNGLMDSGKAILSSIMGNQQSSILDLIGKTTGLKKSSSSSLMNMIAPMVMGMIGKQVASKGLNASSLMNLLAGQKDHLSSALPAGMGNILGFANTSNNSSSSKSTQQQSSSGGGGFMKWLLLGLGALLLLGYFGFRSGCGAVDNAASTVTDTATDIAKTSSDAMGSAVDGTVNAASSALNGTVDAAGNLVDETGNIVAKAGEFSKDAAGNMINVASKKAEALTDAAGNAMSDASDAVGNVANNAIEFTIDESGNLLDASGKIAYKAGDFKTTEDGYYVDKKGNRIGKMFKKIGDAIGDATKATGKAIGNAAEKTGDFFKNTFSDMFKKKAGTETTYELSQIKFNPENHRITDFSKNELDGLAAALKADPNAKIKVQSYTSDAKNKLANKTLSNTRAKVVHDMLVTLGVNKDQISFKGLGSKNDAKAAANKVEIIVE